MQLRINVRRRRRKTRQEAKGTGFFVCLCFSFHLQCGMVGVTLNRYIGAERGTSARAIEEDRQNPMAIDQAKV